MLDKIYENSFEKISHNNYKNRWMIAKNYPDVNMVNAEVSVFKYRIKKLRKDTYRGEILCLQLR